MEYINGQMGKFILDNLEMDIWKGMENFLCQIEKENILANFHRI